MRTVESAASSVASGSKPEQVFYDTELRDTKHRAVEAPVFTSGTRLADTHAHLDMLHYPELVLARAAAHGVSFIVTVIDPTEDPPYTLDNLETWQKDAKGLRSESNTPLSSCAFERSSNVAGPTHTESDKPPLVPDVAISMGCHPHNAAAYTQEVEDALLHSLTTDARVVGIGEIGLDYHYDHSPRDVQQQVYRRQLRLAHELGSTVTLHMREAHADGLRILKEEGVPKAGFLLHCFNLDYATLEPFLELGAMVAFGGPLTFAKANEVRDSAARCPLNRIMTETDCPFMAPTPIRGSICEPASVVFTAKKLEELRAEPHALEAAYANAKKFFSK